MDIKELVSIPPKCVYAFLNDRNKKIQLFYTSNCLISLVRNTQEFRFYIDRDQLEFRVIETVPGQINPRFRFTYWKDHFTSLGYQFYRDVKGSNYNFKTLILTDHRVIDKPIFVAYLINSSHKKLVVGAFEKKADLDLFRDQHYQGKIYEIVVHETELTKKVKEFYAA